MASASENREQIVRYLLDEMNQIERTQMEERLVRDPSFFETIAAAEDDLIMQYLRGNLGRELLPRFTEVYMESPARRARVESARVLRDAVYVIKSARGKVPLRPRLVVLSGPLKDSIIPLTESETTVGREASNDIPVTDPSVSREHFRLSCEGGRYRVQDLVSRNGTLVNGSKVEEHWLRHGDEIAAGDSSFLFLEEEELAPIASHVEFEDAQGTAETTVIDPRDVVYPRPDQLSRELLENARHLAWLEEENERLTVEIGRDWNLIGESPKMKEVYQFVKRAAPAESTVLIGGESGTGKELAARALHRNSPRANKPFVAINCAAIPEALLETELFGYERGAFTGASAQKRGKLEVANGGTVFLDEIGELAPALQVKLLRVLQEREFERVGGTNSIKVNIRLIAATNYDLDQAVREGNFHQDLYYRLVVLPITMPALRERREDIPMLARHFVQKHAKRYKLKPRPISREAISCLVNYDWPSNVRELENAIEYALVMGASEMILPEDLPEALLEHTAPPEIIEAKYHAAVKELKKQLTLDAVEQTQGNYADAARILGVHPNYLNRLIRNLGLKEILNERFRRGE